MGHKPSEASPALPRYPGPVGSASTFSLWKHPYFPFGFTCPEGSGTFFKELIVNLVTDHLLPKLAMLSA